MYNCLFHKGVCSCASWRGRRPSSSQGRRLSLFYDFIYAFMCPKYINGVQGILENGPSTPLPFETLSETYFAQLMNKVLPE